MIKFVALMGALGCLAVAVTVFAVHAPDAPPVPAIVGVVAITSCQQLAGVITVDSNGKLAPANMTPEELLAMIKRLNLPTTNAIDADVPCQPETRWTAR